MCYPTRRYRESVLHTVPDQPLSISIGMLAKAELASGGRRYVYFETSREGVTDRQGEDIAASALWASRDLFLTQGNLDLNHWSWLGNPYGSGARPEYVIGLPVDVKRTGKSIYVKGEVFGNKTPPPEDHIGHWADQFWHSITAMRPAQRWYPSVFGSVKPNGWRTEQRGGKTIRFMTAVDWYSVGFAQRAQHPTLPPVSTSPLGSFAKADGLVQPVHLTDWGTFAKALAVGAPVTDSAAKVGVQAVTPESLEGSKRAHRAYEDVHGDVLKDVLRRIVPARREAIAKAFMARGCDEFTAAAYAHRLLTDAARDWNG